MSIEVLSRSTPPGARSGWLSRLAPAGWNTNTQFFVIFLGVVVLHLLFAPALMRWAGEPEPGEPRRYLTSGEGDGPGAASAAAETPPATEDTVGLEENDDDAEDPASPPAGEVSLAQSGSGTDDSGDSPSSEPDPAPTESASAGEPLVAHPVTPATASPEPEKEGPPPPGELAKKGEGKRRFRQLH